MNFLLNEIENKIDETSLLKGEVLLADGKVKNLKEIEKHLWVGIVTDTSPYEVEVKITPSRVQAGSCECQRFQDIGICEHLAAVLLLLRRNKMDWKQKTQQKKRRKSKAPKKLTTGAVLDTVSHEELVAFARQYAKTNRNFALALKARFASSVSIEEGKDKYLQLLESAISLARKTDRNISLRGSQKIYKVLLEMQGQIQDAIVKKYYAEAFRMIQSILEKISPILRKMEKMQEEMKGQLRQAFLSLQQIISEHPPPALKAEMWEYCLGECTKLLYRNNQLDLRFFKIMHALADDSDKKDQLSKLLSTQLRKYEYEGRNPGSILLLQMQILESLQRTEEAQLLLKRFISEPEILRFAVRQALQKNEFNKAKKLIRNGLEHPLPHTIRAELEESLLHIAEQENDQLAITELAQNRLLQTLDFSYVEILKKTDKDHWLKQKGKLLEKLEQLPFSPEKLQTIAQIHTSDQQWPQLLEHLENARSLDLLRQFDAYLLPEYKKRVFALYHLLLDEYLHNHLGRKPSTRIRQILQHLYEAGAESFVQDLVEKYRSNYPERHTLMEELSLFHN